MDSRQRYKINKNKLSNKIKKEKINFIPSGILYDHKYNTSNKFKYIEPFNKAIPISNCFKIIPIENDMNYKSIELSSSFIIFGRDKYTCDILLEDYSVSKQHAIIQFINTKVNYSDCLVGLPYIYDLNSKNYTYLNNKIINKYSYIQLNHKDIIRFGNSNKEFVVYYNIN